VQVQGGKSKKETFPPLEVNKKGQREEEVKPKREAKKDRI